MSDIKKALLELGWSQDLIEAFVFSTPIPVGPDSTDFNMTVECVDVTDLTVEIDELGMEEESMTTTKKAEAAKDWRHTNCCDCAISFSYRYDSRTGRYPMVRCARCAAMLHRRQHLRRLEYARNHW